MDKKTIKTKLNDPIIHTEYAHALGLSFGSMKDIWQKNIQ